MKIVFCNVKKIDQRTGCLICNEAHVLKKTCEFFDKFEHVESCTPTSAHTLRFVAKEGLTLEQVCHEITPILDLYTSEAMVYPSWLARNFWPLWGAFFGIIYALEIADSFLWGGGESVWQWYISGVLVMLLALYNYKRGKDKYTRQIQSIRDDFKGILHAYKNTSDA